MLIVNAKTCSEFRSYPESYPVPCPPAPLLTIIAASGPSSRGLRHSRCKIALRARPVQHADTGSTPDRTKGRTPPFRTCRVFLNNEEKLLAITPPAHVQTDRISARYCAFPLANGQRSSRRVKPGRRENMASRLKSVAGLAAASAKLRRHHGQAGFGSPKLANQNGMKSGRGKICTATMGGQHNLVPMSCRATNTELRVSRSVPRSALNTELPRLKVRFQNSAWQTL